MVRTYSGGLEKDRSTTNQFIRKAKKVDKGVFFLL